MSTHRTRSLLALVAFSLCLPSHVFGQVLETRVENAPELKVTTISLLSEARLSDGRTLLEFRHALRNVGAGTWRDTGSTVKRTLAGVPVEPLRTVVRLASLLARGQVARGTSNEALHVVVNVADEPAFRTLIESGRLMSVRARTDGGRILNPPGLFIERGEVLKASTLPTGQRLLEFTASVRHGNSGSSCRSVDLEVNPTATSLTSSFLVGGMSFPGPLPPGATVTSTGSCFVMAAADQAEAVRTALLAGRLWQGQGVDVMQFPMPVKSFDSGTSSLFTPEESSASTQEVVLAFRANSLFLDGLSSGELLTGDVSGEDYFASFPPVTATAVTDLPKFLPVTVKTVEHVGARVILTGARVDLAKLAQSGSFTGSSASGFRDPVRDPYNPPIGNTHTAAEKSARAGEAAATAAQDALNSELADLIGFSGTPFHFNDFKIVDGVTMSGQVTINAIPIQFDFYKRGGAVQGVRVQSTLDVSAHLVVEVGDGIPRYKVDNEKDELFPPILLPEIKIAGEYLTIQPKITGHLVVNADLPRTFTIPMLSTCRVSQETVWDKDTGFSSVPSQEFVPLHISDPELFEQLNASATVGVEFGLDILIEPTDLMNLAIGLKATPGVTTFVTPTEDIWLRSSGDILVSGNVAGHLAGVTLFDIPIAPTNIHIFGFDSSMLTLPAFPAGAEPVRPVTGGELRWARAVSPPGLWNNAEEATITPFGDPGGFVVGWKRGVMARFSPRGELLWMLGSTASGPLNPTTILALPDNTLTVVANNGGSAIQVSHYDANGHRLWVVQYDIPALTLTSAATRSNGAAVEYFLAGYQGIVGDPEGRNAVVLRLDAAGGILWGKKYPASNVNAVSENGQDIARSITLLADGNLLVAGTTAHRINQDVFHKSWLMKIDADGAVRWSTAVAGETFNHAIETPDGTLFATGTTGINHADHPIPSAQLVSFTPDGDLLDYTTIGTDPDAGVLDVGVDQAKALYWANNGLWVCGTRDLAHPQGWLMRLDAKFRAGAYMHFDGGPGHKLVLGTMMSLPDGLAMAGDTDGARIPDGTYADLPLVMKVPWEGIMRFHERHPGLQSQFVRPRVFVPWNDEYWGPVKAFLMGETQEGDPGVEYYKWTFGGEPLTDITASVPPGPPSLVGVPVVVAIEKQSRNAITSYDQWAYYYQLPAPNNTPEADYDGDGISNGTEAYYDLDPRSPSTLPGMRVHAAPLAGSARTVLEANRASFARYLTSPLETSTDLVRWSPITSSSQETQPLGGGRELVQFHFPEPDPWRFFRTRR